MFNTVYITLKYLTNTRFRRDIKAFKITKIMYPFYAWEFLKKMDITSILKTGSTIEEIMQKKPLKNRYFLESILDILVGSKVLKYESGKYFFVKLPENYIDKDKKFLEKYCPYSVKWTEKLMSKAEGVLVSGKKPIDTGFDDSDSLDLWDGIMKEAPYSFRDIAIKQLLKNIKDDSYILDIGCGGGIDIEHILLNANKKINIIALDISDKYIERTKKRIHKLYDSTDNFVIKKNIRRIEYINSDILTDNLSKYKFDGMFMSLVLNHIPRDKLPGLIQKLSSMLNENGKLSIYQLLNTSKFDRVPIWVMHTVPSHYEYPYKDEYLKILNDNFRKVKTFANCNITVAEK